MLLPNANFQVVGNPHPVLSIARSIPATALLDDGATYPGRMSALPKNQKA
jgi:hypothetical protein